MKRQPSTGVRNSSLKHGSNFVHSMTVCFSDDLLLAWGFTVCPYPKVRWGQSNSESNQDSYPLCSTVQLSSWQTKPWICFDRFFFQILSNFSPNSPSSGIKKVIVV